MLCRMERVLLGSVVRERLHELCVQTFWVQGSVRPKTPFLGRTEALLGTARLSPSNG